LICGFPAQVDADELKPGCVLERFNIENVEMLWRRAPPPAPQAQAKLASAVAAQQLTDEDSSDVSPSSAGGSVSKLNCSRS
jgi:hypothetical protein